jgi:hypothetical protein
VADFVALLQHQRLLDQVGNEWHALKDAEDLPVFVFEGPAHRRRRSWYTPGVILKDARARRPPDELSAPLRMLDRFARSYRDLRILAEPRTIQLGAASGTTTTWTYLHEVMNIAQPLKVETLLVFRGGRAHTFHLTDHGDKPCVNEEVWTDFRSSLRYT